MTSTNLKITKARVALVTSQPFFGALALKLDVVEKQGLGTMATNGVALSFDPAFTDPMPMPELIGVVAHEVMHCALHHMTRRGNRDAKLWNIACDYAVNEIVKGAGFTLPKEALIDAQYAGMSAEQIYSKLQQQQSGDAGSGGGSSGGAGQGEPQPGDGNNYGGCGEVTDAPGEGGGQPSEASNAALDAEWDIATMQAAQAGKAAGKLPGCATELVDKIRKPSIDYREALRRFMLNRVPTDSTWSPPNRRFVSRGLYLPSLRCENMGEIVVAIDTSGSTHAFRPQFAGDLTAISEDLRPRVLHVIYCDTKVQRHDEIEPGEPVSASMMGGGGTDFRPIFDYVAKRGIDPACLVLLTDLEGPMPARAPDYPVVTICTSDLIAPFGETIKITLDAEARR